jgi:2-oxoacid:acceptor oxidoreductase delta subunit (pyruvate/2-ketoisovalerate family)
MKYESPFEGPWGDSKNLKKLPTSTWRHQRPVTDASKCRQCGLCFIFCPIGCVEEKETHFEVNLEFCKGCATCMNVCPSRAITMESERRGEADAN